MLWGIIFAKIVELRKLFVFLGDYYHAERGTCCMTSERNHSPVKAKMVQQRFNLISAHSISPNIPHEDALLLQTANGYKLLPLKPNVNKIYLEVTSLCNFDCQTCIRNSWDEPMGKMSTQVFSQIVRQLEELPDLQCVHLGGFGEPLSHPEIFSFIETLKGKNLQVELITNGSLLNDACIEELIHLRLDKLFVSLDGPDETEYNLIRQGGDFANVTANITRLKRRKAELQTKLPELAIEFVAMKKNFHCLPDLVKLIDKLGASYLLVTNVLPYSEELKDEILYDLDDSLPVFGNTSILSTLRARMPQMKLRTERYCKFIADNALTITWDGQVAPCYALMHTYTCYIYGRSKQIYPYHLGHVSESSLASIWQNPEYVYFRSLVHDFSFPSCTDCKFLEGCNYPDNNQMDCWGNSPTCSDCLWSRGMIVCP